MHKFLPASYEHMHVQLSRRARQGHEPQGTSSLDNYFLLAVRQTGDERADNVFSLQEPSRRRIVLYQIRHGNACPFSFDGICAVHLWLARSADSPIVRGGSLTF